MRGMVDFFQHALLGGGGGGGLGKNQKKIHSRENAKKKNSRKEEGKEKKFMQKEGPIVTFIYSAFHKTVDRRFAKFVVNLISSLPTWEFQYVTVNQRANFESVKKGSQPCTIPLYVVWFLLPLS